VLAAALVGIALVLLAIGIWAVGIWRSADDATATSSLPLERAVDEAQPAKRPFSGLTATRVAAGGHAMKVVVADDVDERSAGLRQRSDVGPYDGILFAFDEPTATAFTMSTVPVALDIGFYDSSGRVVDRLRMEPCAGSEAECPVYRASGPFVYALETLADELPRGRLRARSPG
jgi:uncharacterized membrane protein (UPF0127 family)